MPEFRISLEKDDPPDSSTSELQAMWYEAKGNWDKAHMIVQYLPGSNAAWVHAYLHRKEPDEWNAAYWYSRAGRKMPDVSFKEEWEVITAELLKID